MLNYIAKNYFFQIKKYGRIFMRPYSQHVPVLTASTTHVMGCGSFGVPDYGRYYEPLFPSQPLGELRIYIEPYKYRRFYIYFTNILLICQSYFSFDFIIEILINSACLAIISYTIASIIHT